MNRETQGRERLTAGRLAAVTLLAIALVVAGCGGGGGKSSTSGKAAHKPKHPPRPAPKAVAEGVRKAGPSAIFSHSVSASPGDILIFRTIAPAIAGKHKPAQTENVKLTLPTGSATKMTVQVSAAGKTASAAVSSAGGKSINFARVGYTCFLPPRRTFCPLKAGSPAGGTLSYKLALHPGEMLPLTVVVGPKTFPTSKVKATNKKVQPYKVREFVKVGTPGSSNQTSAPTKPGPSATVKDGDVVRLITRLIGKPGLPQPVTVTVPQGAASTIKITASLPGSHPATATLKSSSGSVQLFAARYSCLLPPQPTFCPATQAKTSGGSSSVSFTVNPLTPVVLIARVQKA